ncbi:hypothetical protein HMSSN139_03380 [Paenibacillus sp. HMSSN-139]|nr:hypothetical protein HMSSN139_03380 [Paenibacillus sp. HMSSN-139]
MIQGIGAAAGVAIGKAFVLPAWEWDVPDRRMEKVDLAKEFERLYEGIRTSKTEIEVMKNEIKETVGAEESGIFDAHLAILEDPVFMSEIRGIIERQYKAAEVAVKEAIDHFVTMFDLLDDEYMKERALDIKDVGNRLLKHLLGTPDITLPADTQPYILVAKELSPSQLVHLNPDNVLGMVTMAGGKTSHSAIMARALGIPLVSGLENKLAEPLQTGDLLVIDGDEGLVYLNPEPAVVTRYTELAEKQRRRKEQLQLLASVEAVTKDGVRMRLAGNISSVKDLELALKHGAEGVGLFRTDFCIWTGPLFRAKTSSSRCIGKSRRKPGRTRSSFGRWTSAATSNWNTSSCRKRRIRCWVTAGSASAWIVASCSERSLPPFYAPVPMAK